MMAKLNYLISGLPGTGKTTVYNELVARHIYAIDADSVLAARSTEGWLWDQQKILSLINDRASEVLFVCGSATNRDEYIDLFDKVFILYVDDDTLRTRLQNRTNNNFGKAPAVLARQLANNQGVKDYSLKRGRIVIDAMQAVESIVDEILDAI
ncbi:MAG: hypothetical protein EOO18_02755 [Chryseobacterium sp.]|nr:MAG: hypothetical protein EOO18_02755 [Chryseobacterium sp.]